MKKLFLMALLPILLLIGTSSGNIANAQTTTVQIGTGTMSQNTLPFNNFYKNSYSQMIYYKSEIGQSGYIGALQFQNASSASITCSEVTIWLAHTPDSIIASSYSWVPQDSLRQVFHALNYTLPEGNGILEIPLDSNFFYDGVHHLALIVSHKAPDYESNVKFKYSETPDYSCLYYRNDSDVTAADYPGSRSGTTTDWRPNLGLVMSPSGVFCFSVATINVLGSTENSISIEWNSTSNPDPYEVAILNPLIDGTDLDDASVTEVTDNEYTFDDLDPNTEYLIAVRQQCGSEYSEWRSISVRTSPTPMYLPFICDFESEEVRSIWDIDNGSQLNRWVIDTLARYGEDSEYGMYITNDNLHHNAYDISGAVGNVFAKCLFHFDANEYNIAFDWKGVGESTWDYLRVMLVPAGNIDVMVSGTTVPSGVGPAILPPGVIALDGGSKLNLSPEWQHYMNVVNIANEGNYYLVFMWRNDGSGGVNPPSAIDNIVLEAASCPGVDSVVVDNITLNSATIYGYSRSGDDFILYYAPYASDDYDTLNITTPYVLNGLLPGTYYKGFLRSNCGEDNASYTVTPFQFGTECVDITLPWAYGFESTFMKHTIGSETFPYCWEALNGQSTSYYWYDNHALANVNSGETALFFTGSSSSTTHHDDWLFTPPITFTGNDEMSFWVRTTTSTTTELYRGRFSLYASDDDISHIRDTAHYEQLAITGVDVSDNYVSFVGNEWRKITIHLPASLVGEHHLAFVIKDINSYSFCLDDIYIYPSSTCNMPTNPHLTNLSSSTATVAWMSDAPSFTVYYDIPPFNIATASSIESVNNAVLIENLLPNQTYEYCVVAHCDDNTLSAPTYPEYFTTTCSPISSEDLPFTENFSDNLVGSTYPLDDCWVRGTNYSSVYPYVNGTEGNGNPNSLYFYSNTTCYSYVALPEFQEDVSNLILSCSIRRYTSSGYNSSLILGLMDNPYDINTFVAYDTLEPIEMGEWTDFQISLGQYDSEDGKFLAFLLPAGQTGYSHLDNIEVALRGACDSPTDLVTTAVYATTASIAWTDTEASSWAVYYGLPGFNLDTVSSPIIVSEPMATLDNLSPQTTYEYKVLSNCGDGSYSAPSISAQFTTACAPISSLPYTEDFESYSSGASYPISPCWTKHAFGTTTQFPYPYLSAAINGNRGLYFRAYEYSTTKYNCYAALPMFTEEISNLKLKFNMKSYKGTSSTYLYSSILAVGVMTNPDDIATFDTLAIFDMSSYPSNTVHTYEYMFNNYDGDGQFIALLALNIPRGTYTDSDNTIYVDDIEVDLIPTCYRPTEFSADVSAHSANLSWVGNASSYEVCYSLHQDMSDSTVITTTTPNCTLTNLTPYTHYYVNVRGVCGPDSYSEWLLMPQLITTSMDCGEGYQNFIDTIGTATSISSSYVINGSSSYVHAKNWLIFSAEELAEMGLVSNSNRIHSISVEVEDAGSPVALKVYMAETSSDEFDINFADTIALSQMTLVYDHTLHLTSDSWNEIMLDTPFLYSDTMNLMIAFERTNTISTTTYFYCTSGNSYNTAYAYTYAAGDSYTYRTLYRGNMIFNVCGEVPTCVRPSNIAVNNISATSIDLSWQGTASQYQVAYNTEHMLPSDISSNSIIVTSNQATLQDLASNTTYYIYVRSICGNDTSIWSNPIIRTTPCAAIDLPYSENFDSYPATTSVPGGQTLDPCWTKGTNYSSEYPFVYTTYANSLPNSFDFYSTASYYSYAALPAFTTPISNISMTFKLHKTSLNYGKIYIGVMTDPNDISTFYRVASAQPTENYEWQDFEVSFGSYTGNGNYIAFMLPDSVTSYAQLDDIEVFQTPTCQAPTNVTVPAVSITSTSAIVQWTDRSASPANGYELEYGIQGFELGTGTRVTSTSNPTTLNNLLVGTCYDVYVRSLCSSTDESRWSFPASFNTDCGPIALPVYYDFENYETGSAVPLPHCFHRYTDGTSNYPYIYNTSYDAHQGKKCIYYYVGYSSSDANNTAMIFPEIDVANYPMNNNQISFWAKGDYIPSVILVGVMSSYSNISSFVALDSITLTSDYAEYTVPFNNYTGTGTYPALLVRRLNSSQYIYVDDVSIEVMPNCPRVEDIRAIAATSNTATISWVDTSSTSQWAIDYRVAGSNTQTTITATTNPFTITGLSPITKYQFNVRPICSVGDTSYPVRNDAYFWTTQIPASVPYTYDFEEATEWNNWQTNSNCSINWYRGSNVASQGTYSMYVSDDNGVTRSSQWDRVVNAVAYRDIDFGPDTASFALTFKASVGGTIDHFYDAVSVLLVDPTEEVEASASSITSPWGNVNDVSLLSIHLDTNWTSHTVYLEHICGVQRVVFYWFNQSTGASNPYINKAGAIDEISIQEQTCMRPYNLNVNNLETTSAQLTWRGTASTYEVAYCEVTNDELNVITQTVQGNSLDIVNLLPVTQYAFQVRAICAEGDTSYWSDISLFTTICDRYVAADTIREDFSNVTGTTYSVAGYLPDCWEAHTNGNNGVLPHVISSGSYWYAHNGKSLVLTAGNTSYGTQATVRLPYTVEPVSALTLSFWMCTESSTNGNLEIGYLTGPDLATDFVAVKNIPASYDTQYDITTGEQTGTSGYWDTVSFAGAPIEAQALAFRWNYSSIFYSVCLDDIVITADESCSAPIINSTVVNFDNATINWSSTASQHQLLYKESTSTQWSDTILVTTNNYTFTNLQALTQYDVIIRALCGDDNGNSSWTSTQFITADLPCYTPTGVEVSNIGYDKATIQWNSTGEPSRWIINLFSTIENRIDTVTSNPITITNLSAASNYSIAVKSLCSDLIASEWSDTVTFATNDCSTVTNVAVNNITTHSAVVTWNNNNSIKWEINYGFEGFGQGEGIFAETATNTYTINNLDEHTTYDLYVRSYCTDNIYSVWSKKVQFTTESESPHGIDGVEGNFKFTIYPNPSNGASTISLQGIEGKVDITIIDLNGRTLFTETIECGIDCEKRIDVANLAQGTYFVRVVGNNINSVRKLIIK